LRHSPWRYFLFQILTFHKPFPWGDYWNWQFGLVAVIVCGASFAALAATAGLRVLMAYRDTEESRRPAITLPIGGGAVIVGLLGILFGPARQMGWLAIAACVVLSAIAVPIYFGGDRLARRYFREERLAFLPPSVASLALIIGIFAAPPYDPEHSGNAAFANVAAALAVQVADAVILGLVVASILRLAERAAPMAKEVRDARDALQEAERSLKRLRLVRSAGHPALVKAQEEVKAREATKKDRDRALNRHTRAAVAAVPLIAGVSIMAAEVLLCSPRPPYDSLLYLERALILGNGVTPLAPVLLLGIVAVAWIVVQVRRVDYVDRFWSDRVADQKMRPMELSIDEYSGLEAVRRRKARMTPVGQDVRVLLYSPLPGALFRSPVSWVALGLTVLFAVRVYERFIPTVDGIAYSRCIVLAFGFLTFAVALSLCRFVLVWSSIRRLLGEFAQIPMQRAFDRIPRSLTRQFGPYLNALPPWLQNMEVHVRQWAAVARDFDADAVGRSLFGNPRGRKLKALKALAEVIRGDELKAVAGGRRDEPADRIMRAFEAECADPVRSVRLSCSEVRRGIRRATAACMTVLTPYWTTRSLDDGFGETPRDKGAGAKRGPAPEAGPTPGPAGATAATNGVAGDPGVMSNSPGEAGTAAWRKAAVMEMRSPRFLPYEDERFVRWLEQAEDLLALELVHFVSECMIHLKNLTVFLTFSPLLLLIAAASYPFQPGQFLVTSLWVLLCVVGVSIVLVYVQMERNEVLSRVSKTSPDRITFNWTFVTQIMAVGVPLVASALARFPFFSDTFNQWLDPIFRVMK
jgi:hypothetical protein